VKYLVFSTSKNELWLNTVFVGRPDPNGLPPSVSASSSNSFPPDQELGALTNEQAIRSLV
jgi:hypothetical protein